MTLAVTYTRATIGMQAPEVSIEVHISNGLPALTLVGLPETTVKEARDRVRSALINSGFTFPAKRITVNLAPADLPKEGGRYDLPIALAILAASEQIAGEKLAQYEFLGELGLSGSLRGVHGAIPAAMEAQKAGRGLILPEDNKLEMTLIPHGDTLLANHLLQVCAFLQGETALLRGSEIPHTISPPYLSARPERNHWPGTSETCTGNRGGRWTQFAITRPTRNRQNDAGQPPARFTARA
ncbi:hypothetical protein OS11_43590 [Dickeya oryzae]